MKETDTNNNHNHNNNHNEDHIHSTCLSPNLTNQTKQTSPCYQAILFDLDGTLVDTLKVITSSFEHTLNGLLKKNLPQEKFVEDVGMPLATQMEHLTNSVEERDFAVREYRKHNKIIHDKNIRSFRGMKETLEQLDQQGIPMAIVTGKRYRQAKRGLEIFSLENYFKFIISSDNFPIPKPQADPLLEGCKRLKVKPQNCLYVGDSPTDIKAAHAAQCISVAVCWGGFFTAERLLEYKPDYLIHKPQELLKL